MNSKATPRASRIGRSREFLEDGIQLIVVRPAEQGVGTVSASTVLPLDASSREMSVAYAALEDSLRGAA
jgi:hypothetical protein